MKKTIAIIAGVIPAVSAVIAIFLMVSHFDSAVIRIAINITTFLGFLGFVFFLLAASLRERIKPSVSWVFWICLLWQVSLDSTLLQSLHLGCDFGIVERDSYLIGRLS